MRHLGLFLLLAPLGTCTSPNPDACPGLCALDGGKGTDLGDGGRGADLGSRDGGSTGGACKSDNDCVWRDMSWSPDPRCIQPVYTPQGPGCPPIA